MKERSFALPIGAFVVSLAVVWLLGFWAGNDALFHRDAIVGYDLSRLAGEATTYESICQVPSDREYADLCQQWRSAEAATLAARYAQQQLVFSVVGALGLLATVALTARATLTAIEANATSRKLGEAQVRAYVAWDHLLHATGRSIEDNTLTGFQLTPAIRNSGQSPANLTRLFSSLIELDEGVVPEVAFDPAGSELNHSLGAGNLFNMASQFLSVELAKKIRSGHATCYLMGWGSYRDVFWMEGQPEHVFSFCFVVRVMNEPVFVDREPTAQIIDLHSISKYTMGPTSS